MSNLQSWSLIQTLSELKEALDITTPDHDAKLNGYLSRATAIIEAYCQRRFISTIYTNEEYEGTDTQVLYVRNYPIITLSAVEYRSNSDLANPSWATLETTLFNVLTQGGKDRGAIFYAGGFSKNRPFSGDTSYRVTYTAGYTATDLPYDLREACIEIAGHLFNSRRADRLMKSESLGQYSYTRESVAKTGIIKALGLDAILDNYRSIPV